LSVGALSCHADFDGYADEIRLLLSDETIVETPFSWFISGDARLPFRLESDSRTDTTSFLRVARLENYY
jgi:hypothetical protein